VYSTKGQLIKQVQLPGLGTTSGFEGLHDDTVVFYTYTSFNYPTHIYKYNIASGKSSLYRKPEIPFNPEDYSVTQKFFTGRDGTKVPMFIVHRKDIVLDGNNPTLIYGYGGFNISIEPQFSASLMPWLEQGGVYASVTLRGGGEYGENWHKAGMLDRKQNVFDDFIGAAKYLISKKYTSPSKLAIRGASNGGLLIGAVINQRPDLFKVAIPEVGVMDMLRFQHFTIGWNWIAEYGSSTDKKQFETLYKYSPLHNIRAGAEYPATLIVTADHDDRVVPAHSFKYTATLQEKAAATNPVLLKIDENSGHGYSSIMKNIELAADIYSFILFNLSVQWKDVK
jgi:prolyl oligopeptidase